MPRKGWSSLQTPTGLAGARTAVVAFLFFVMVAVWRPVASFEVTDSRCGGGNVDRTRGNNPDEVLAAARTKVSRLERAIDALESIVPLQLPARDGSELISILIENGGTVAGSSNRFSPLT